MAGCCAVPEKPQSENWQCPKCGRKGKPVPRVTLDLLHPDAKARLTDAAYLFCETPDCPIVYFAPDDGSVFHKADLIVRVGIKETEPPIPLCYCFDYTREMLWAELEATGKTTIPDRIKAEVQAGNCRCEFTNPRGSCCLGDIQRAIQAFKKEGQIRRGERQFAHSAPVTITTQDCCAVPPEDAGHDCCALPPDEEQTNQSVAYDTCCAVPTIAASEAKPERMGILAGIGAAIFGLLASACCWLPALLAALGASSAGLGAKFAPYRPYFAIGALTLIGTAFAITYRRQPKEACCLTPQQKATRFGLWAALVIVLASLAFPTVWGWWEQRNIHHEAVASLDDGHRITFRIEGMSCAGCATMIAAKLKEVPNVVNATVNFETDEATVFWQGKPPSKEALANAVASVEGRAVFNK